MSDTKPIVHHEFAVTVDNEVAVIAPLENNPHLKPIVQSNEDLYFEFYDNQIFINHSSVPVVVDHIPDVALNALKKGPEVVLAVVGKKNGQDVVLDKTIPCFNQPVVGEGVAVEFD